jgi:hypothetical protein
MKLSRRAASSIFTAATDAPLHSDATAIGSATVAQWPMTRTAVRAG